MSVGVIILDLDHIIIYMNHYADRHLENLFLGASIFDCQMQALIQVYEQAVNSGQVTAKTIAPTLMAEAASVNLTPPGLGGIITIKDRQ